MAWCFSTRTLVATVLTTHPCVSRCLRVHLNYLLVPMPLPSWHWLTHLIAQSPWGSKVASCSSLFWQSFPESNKVGYVKPQLDYKGILLHISQQVSLKTLHDDIMAQKHFPLDWPFVNVIYQSPVDSPHKGPVMQALVFSFVVCLHNQLNKQMELPMIWDPMTLM